MDLNDKIIPLTRSDMDFKDFENGYNFILLWKTKWMLFLPEIKKVLKMLRSLS